MSQLRTRLDTKSDDFKANQDYNLNLSNILRERLDAFTSSGRAELIERHLKRSKILVRDRIDLLIDPATPFLEFSPLAAWGQYNNELPSAGIVTGIGVVSRTPCVIIANDATVKGGSFYAETVKKHIRAQEIAAENRLPCIYLVDCGGANLPQQDKVFPDRDHFGNAFHRQCNMSASGLPQLSIVFGGCTAGGAYIPALSDQNIMVKGNARIHLGGPSIVKVAINEVIDGETLGGAEMHTHISGVSDHMVEDEPEAIALMRDIVGDLNMARDVSIESSIIQDPLYPIDELSGVISHDRRIPYDVREIIMRLVDASNFQEFKPEWGDAVVCGTARIFTNPVGVIGNNAALTNQAALKAAHFIELCNQRHIPILFLHNITGFMVGSEAEQMGIAKNSAKMVYAMSTAQVPKISVIVGGSYGAGNYGMCGRGFRPNFMFAWPSAELATMSADIASNVMLELRKSNVKANPASSEELAAIEKAVRDQYEEQSDPYYATSRLWDDGLIEPTQTRDVLALCLSLIKTIPETGLQTPVYRM